MVEVLSSAIFAMLGDLITDLAGRLLEVAPDLEKLRLELLQIEQLLKEREHDKPVLERIRDVVYDLDDAIDEFAVKSREGICTINPLFHSIKAREFRARIKVLCDRVKLIAKTFEPRFPSSVVSDEPRKDPADHWQTTQDQFVGRVQDLQALKSSLESPDVAVVAIVGMGGIGKTTLARQVYSQLPHLYERFAWVNLSNRGELLTVVRELALQLTVETREKVISMSEIALLLQLHEVMLERKCLVVLDDVWSADAWTNLKIAFPSRQSATPSKLLLTTRFSQVGEMVAADSGSFHALGCLPDNESWDLFARTALHPGVETDASLKLIAKEIASKCKGLPLAIISLGGYLRTKSSLAEWSALNQDIDLDKWKERQEMDGIQQLLALSFMDLPVNLKHCLEYLALFLGNSEIEVDKLYPLWFAEGLIRSSYGGGMETVIEIADRYLRELESRGMVKVEVDKISRVRKLRSCRLHSLMRDMSLLRAKEENYLTVMDLRPGKQQSAPGITGKVRRLAAHLGGNKCGTRFSFGQKETDKTRSLLLLDSRTSQHNCFQERSLCMPEFKLLRVLHFDGLDFGVGNYPKHIEKLVLLTYLSFRNCYLEKLPSSISKLLNLQTLDLRVRERCLMTIHNVLRKMGRMKHLYLPQSFLVHNNEKLRLDGLTELETLENFNSKLCFAKDLLQLTNLRFFTASIYENLEDLEATTKCINTASTCLCEASLDIRSFHCFTKAKHAAIQKLFHSNCLNTLHLEGYLGKVSVIASSSLLSVMLFSKSEFDQDPMPLLGKLPNLRVLAFYNYAFLGKQMLCTTMSFCELRHLKLSTMPNLETLTVEEGTMPKLSALTIEECQNLKLHANQLKFLKNLKQAKVTGTAGAFEDLYVRGEALQDETQYDVFPKYSMY